MTIAQTIHPTTTPAKTPVAIEPEVCRIGVAIVEPLVVVEDCPVAPIMDSVELDSELLLGMSEAEVKGVNMLLSV
jgi:hypothetical protein